MENGTKNRLNGLRHGTRLFAFYGRSSKKVRSICVVLLFALMATILVIFSHAATPAVSLESETASLTGVAAVKTDATASAGAALAFGPGNGTGAGSTVTHGNQLTEAMVGPWALQGVAQGSETLQKPAIPSRGYWRLDAPTELVPAGNYTYNSNPGNHGGTLAADTMIDGYLVPAGTKVVQFVDLGDVGVYGQGASGSWLFRGVRSRGNLSAPGFLNIYQSSVTVLIHYSDFGGNGPTDADAADVALQLIGGQNHRVLRSYFTYLTTAIQPNVPGVEITENFIDKITFFYGELGPCGTGGSCVYHLNGISTEGMSNTTPTNFKILRNHITVPSPDEAGHITLQTDCIAMFQSNGGSYNGVQIDSNYLGGTGYTIYTGANPNPTASNEPKNFVVTNNTFTTKWWTDSGSFGPAAAQPNWGSNGNMATNNTWADDYGSGGNGNTPTSARQHPQGDGPRKGQIVFGS